MILYTVLTVIATILIFVAIFFIVVGACIESPTVVCIAFVIGAVVFGCAVWTTYIKEANTTITTEIVQTVVTEKEFSIQEDQGIETIRHYLFVDEGCRVTVSEEEYATILEGDTVEIEIAHVAIFGKVTKEVKLKGCK